MRPGLVVLAAGILLAGCFGQGTGGAGGEPAQAALGTLQGVVTDEAIRPLAGVEVSLSGLDNLTQTTGESGAFEFGDLPPGSYILEVGKAGYVAVQTTAQVVAGEADPATIQVTLAMVPSEKPFVEAHVLTGYLSFGAAVGATSLGTTAYPPLADALGDRSIWSLQFMQLPAWSQGELVWEHTQVAGGELIWEMTNTMNVSVGYSETAPSPALAYWNTSVLEEHVETTLDPDLGIEYRFFGGPHTALKPGNGTCPPLEVDPCRFGYGMTVQQKAEAYVHNFFNFVPADGWRFTVDGDPEVPA